MLKSNDQTKVTSIITFGSLLRELKVSGMLQGVSFQDRESGSKNSIRLWIVLLVRIE